MDEHVRSAVTEGLRMRGIDVLTAQEDGREGADDAEILDRATALGRIVFTQDDDYLREASRRQSVGEPFAGLIYAHQLGVSIRQCIEDIELYSKAGETQDISNQVVFLPLR